MIDEAIWLAADYHFPSTYSCRMRPSSMASALATPGPGPATVRLALIRTSMELVGIEVTRNELFPIIRAAQIRIRPPERVALTNHLIKIYKADSNNKGVRLVESVGYREYAHASGLLTVYVKVPIALEGLVSEVLMTIGYWGQADSLAYCVAVRHGIPRQREVAVPMKSLNSNRQVRDLFPSTLSEFRDQYVAWEEILPDRMRGPQKAIRLDLYVWPMVVRKMGMGGKLLERC